VLAGLASAQANGFVAFGPDMDEYAGGVVVDGDDASATPLGSWGAIGDADPEVFAVLRRSGYRLPTRWVGKARANRSRNEVLRAKVLS